MIFLLAVACGTPEVRPDAPALLVNPGPESRQQIQQVVSSAMNANVMIAEAALTDTSVLVIERGLQRSIGRPPELGRDLGRPYQFQLVTNSTECALIDLQTGRRWPLTGLECVAKAK